MIGFAPRPRSGAALAAVLSVGLVAAGTLAVVLADRPPMDAPVALPWWALLLLYLAAEQITLGFQRREQILFVTLVQLPLALGVVLVAPGVHLAVRLAASTLDSLAWRRGPLKAVVNLGLASVEVGVATGIFALVGPQQHVGPALWGALLVGLLAGGAASSLGMDGLFRIMGMRRAPGDLVEPLAFEAITTTAFAGLAVLTIAAVWTDPSTLAAVVVLAVVLGGSYRAYRRLAAQQRATEDLYALVKDLGPVDVEQPDALRVLEQVRVLLYAKQLELAVADRTGGLVRYLTVQLDAPPVVREGALRDSLGGGPDLRAERMTTPLVVGGAFVGLLTAANRVTRDRGFDMKDLRLLETVATELATALDRGRLLRDLGRAASTDPMTGLPNLHRMTQCLGDLLEQHEAVVLAAVAVDSFREVNDTLGHQVGDDMLCEVAARLHLAAPTAFIGRIGGGRFAVALPAEDAGQDAAMFGLGLRAQVEGSAQLSGIGTHIRLSVGCVRAPEHGEDAPTLLRRAETAMYSARLSHGGPVLWEPAYEVQGQRRLAVVMALREALAAGAIGVAFQPKVSSRTEVTTGVEALARWEHAALHTIDPTEFVPLAEAAGLMGQLTSTVLRQSLAACHEWQSAGACDVGVSVNVSADTLQDPDFVTQVAEALRTSGVPAASLTLELTENVVVADPALAAERMQELQALGLKLSVDDFGTGYSSLTYLKGLPIDEVKIDKGFVAGLVGDAGDQAVVRAVVDIAHTLGVTVVAEGVEHEDQHRLLRSLGVDEEQGYLHAVAMPVHEMTGWLKRRSEVEPLR